ncbi:MAG: hypothetical protein N3A69_04170 [Leptospiraceae bacterium]|nr:hypothetical protein [Leptospiraceae bacterium]
MNLAGLTQEQIPEALLQNIQQTFIELIQNQIEIEPPLLRQIANSLLEDINENNSN